MIVLRRSTLVIICLAAFGCGGGVTGSASPVGTTLTQSAASTPAASATASGPSPSLGAAASPPPPEPVCRDAQAGLPLPSHANDGTPHPGGRIVFGKLAYSNEKGQVVAPLFAIDPDGSDVVQILDCNVERPRISRDGTRLAFSVVMSDGSWQLATSTIDGSDLRILTSTPPGEQEEKTGTPDWSPDGKSLVYARNHTIWSIGANGSNDRLIGEADGFDWEPRFSPDGSSVVFLHGNFTKGVSEPWILDIATGKQRAVFASNDRELEHPDWSPDGKWIIYNTLGPKGELIERMPSDDPDASPEAVFGSVGNFAYKPAYSPDGKSIVFGCSGRLCVMAADGSDVKVLFAMPEFEVNHIAWGVTPT